MKRAVVAFWCLFYGATIATAEEVIDVPESGYRLTIPDVGWSHAVQRGGTGLTTVGVGPQDRGGLIQLSIQPSVVTDNSDDAVREHVAELRAAIVADASISNVDDDGFEIAGHAARGLSVDQAAFGQVFHVRLALFRSRGVQYRVQFHAPQDEFDEQWPTARRVLDGFELIELDAEAMERDRLQQLAARCGSQIAWASTWEDAARQAREQHRLVVVAIHAIRGFSIGHPLNERVFTDPTIVALMEHRFVGMHWRAGMDAPFVSHDVFGLSGTTFGTGLLVCTPAGDVVRQIYLLDAALVRDALRDVLEEHAQWAPAPGVRGDDDAARVTFLLDSGQLDAARTLLDTSADDLALERARLHEMERNGVAALDALTHAEPNAQRALLEADVYLGLGDEQAASRAVTQCLDRAPNDTERSQALLLRGLLQWTDGDVDAARTEWTELTRAFPDESAAWMAAAVLIGPALELDIDPDLSWPTASAARMSRLPEPAVQRTLDGVQARAAAVDWLLAAQRADGAWDTPARARVSHPTPDPITMASNAIAITALARASDRTVDTARAERCRAAVSAGIDRYLAYRTLEREDPSPVAFMDYTCWGSSYGLDCVSLLMDHDAISPGRRLLLREEAAHLVDDLVRVQQANGGWSYYVTGEIGSEAAVVAMSFTTATVLLALDTARERGVDVRDGVIERGTACLAAMRGPQGNYEYMRMGIGTHQASTIAPEGAAARGPVCTEALQRAGRLDESAMAAAFATYVAHLPAYGAESRKALMHAGSAGQGSHYLLYDYATGAHALAGARIDDQARESVRAAILRELARCRSADGSFIDNPLIGPVAGTGLAVSALLDLE